jgi:hypothetical protein
MMWAIIGLSAGFVLVVGFLYLLLIRTKLPITLKLIAVVLATSFYWIQYQSLLEFTGWPSHDQLPSEFVLIASEIVEPNKQTGDDGVIYWWVRDRSDLSLPPRVYQLPYQSAMHEQGEQVLEEQQKGSVYIGKKRQQQGGGAPGMGVSFEKISKASRMQKN